MVRTTPAFNRAVLEPFLERETKGLDPTTTAYYRQRPADIYAELESPNAHLKGFALEAFAIHIMRLLGLRLVGWRKRAASATGQAEVDALMAGMFGGVATTWQVQCKNTRNGVADVEDVAKEVGIAVLTGATHILFVTTGRFSADARVFAASVTDAGSLTLYLLDGEDFAQIRADPTILPRLIADLSEGILKRRLRRPAWT